MASSILLTAVLVSPSGFAADTKAPTTKAASNTIPSADYPLPQFSSTKLPSITSCDVKSGDTSGASAESVTTGNSVIDATTSTASILNKALKKKGEENDDEVGEVEEGVGLDKNCGEASNAHTDSAIAEKMACSRFDEGGDFIASIIEENNAAKKVYACQRGVLAAINGELSCFKKQILQAQSYMNELINSQGGLASMLTAGLTQMGEIDKEVADREAQLGELRHRLENPKTGMGAAKEALDKLSSEIPNQQTEVENAVQRTREQEQRYETLIKQVTMGRTLACLQRATPGYTCVKAGSSSKKYASGNVSPIDYIACIYAQKANQLVGSSVLKNEALEDSRLAKVKSTVSGLSMATMTDIPAYDDKTGYAAAMKSYQVNSPEQLIAAFSAVTSDADKVTKKNVSGQFRSDVTRCYAEAKTQTEADRKDSNTNIGVGKTAMAQAAKSQSAQYASQMRKLKSTYESAVKSATGKSVQLNTARCEAESLENQAKCISAIGSLVDAVLTGDGSAATAKLVGPAATLTSGQLPISGFISELKAPSDATRAANSTHPPRTIRNIDCKGLNECVAKYESLKVELESVVIERKQKKESMKSEINQQITQTAQSIASGKNAQGIPNGSMSLNQVSKGLADRKEQLIQAMKNLRVGGSLDLESEKVGDIDVDEKTGLIKQGSLRDLVLSAIDPRMLANDGKGFADASKDIQKRDEDIEKKQDELDKFVSTLEAQAQKCKSEKKASDLTTAKEYCEKAQTALNDCIQRAKDDELNLRLLSLAAVNKAAQGQSQGNVGEVNSNAVSPIVSLGCGVSPEEVRAKCQYYDQLVENRFKDLDNMGSKSKGPSKSAGAGR